MGMESYNVLILPENVSIIRDDKYWRLGGTSEIDIHVINDELTKLCNKGNRHNEYVLNKCIDIKVYEDKAMFQGFELRGCLSFLKGGTQECFDFYKFWNGKLPLKLFIMNKMIDIESSIDLYNAIYDMYSDKIDIFRKQYGNIEWRISSSNFYSEMKKRKKWYNKMTYWFKRNKL